jgi:hypothetical protein
MEMRASEMWKDRRMKFRCASCGCEWQAGADECAWAPSPADVYEPIKRCPNCGQWTGPEEIEIGFADPAEAAEIVQNLQTIYIWCATGRRLGTGERVEIKKWTERAIQFIQKAGGVE